MLFINMQLKHTPLSYTVSLSTVICMVELQLQLDLSMQLLCCPCHSLHAWESNHVINLNMSHIPTLWTVWENIQDSMLLQTFSFEDDHMCSYSQIHSTDIVFQLHEL